MQYAIKATNLAKQYKDFTAVDNIDFSVRYGETFAILGENGAGKSTTMRMISCRSPLTKGELIVDGFDVKTDEQKIRKILGIVPQENNLDPDLNVLENLLVYARYFRIGNDIAKKRCQDLINFVGLNSKSKAKVDALSGGMKRRLIIARALINNPKILLLDEPTTGLDPSVRQEIWGKLEELRQTKNLTIILSTHYMEEAEKLSQRLVILSAGKIILSGLPADIIKSKAKKFVLEIRSHKTKPVLELDSQIIYSRRGKTHLYFSDTYDDLTVLMNTINTQQMVLRPSNLEDVFLTFVNQTKD